jgi:hypothetical protein
MMAVVAKAIPKGAGSIQMHPMFHANNGGLDYGDVVAGTIDVVRPETCVIEAEAGDVRYMVGWMKTHGAEAAWLRRDAMSGNLVKKHRVSLGLVEEWAALAKFLDSLSGTDIRCALEVLNPEVYTEDLWTHFAEWGVQDLRGGLLYEIGCSTTTVLPHILKQLSRQCIIDRGRTDRERNNPYKYPWDEEVNNEDRTPEDVKSFLLFQDWGKFGRGVHDSLPQTNGFAINRVWITASLGRAGGPMAVDIGDIDVNQPPDCLIFEGNWAAEGKLIAKTEDGTVLATYDLYWRFVQKFGADDVRVYCEPSPRNPNLGQDPVSLPGTMAFKFTPKTTPLNKAKPQEEGKAKAAKNKAHAKVMANWGFNHQDGGIPLPKAPLPVMQAPLLAPPPAKANPEPGAGIIPAGNAAKNGKAPGPAPAKDGPPVPAPAKDGPPVPKDGGPPAKAKAS